ncbi:hypothetical protein GCM10023148_49920 [Actinokineospora soli]
MTDLHALLARHGIPADELAWLGEGEDNTAYTAGDLVIRLAKRANGSESRDAAAHDATAPVDRDVAAPVDRDVAAAVRRDAAVLLAVADLLAAAHVPLAIPTPLVVDPDAGLLVYRKVPGTPMRWADQPLGDSAEAVAAMLSALHNAPAAELGAIAGVDDDTPDDWLAEAVESYPAIAPVLTAAQRRAVEAFLAAEPPPVGTPLVFSHNDLGAEHLLADGGTVVGVIDWTDASVSDPARDFSRLHRDFGPATHDAVLQHYQGPYGPADAERTRFFARCGLLEDAAYGLRTGADAYLRAALASFPHTFD